MIWNQILMRIKIVTIGTCSKDTQEEPSYECGVVTDEGGAKLN